MAKILVVDDERSIRLTLSEFLKREGYETDTAENCDAAVELLQHADYDVMLTDIVMPRRSGMSLVSDAQRLQPYVRVILMTGEPTVETASAAVRLDAQDYLAKPIAREELLRTVRQAVELKHLSDEKRRLEADLLRQKMNLEREVEERTQKLRLAMLNIAFATGAMLELRDPYTAGHQRRVGALAGEIGRVMGLPDDTLEGLHLIGCIHDIGKIMVPTDILSKPGRLSKLEYALIQEHPMKGYEVLRNYEMPWPVAEIVYQHHERLNGSGYPRGLKGSEIALETCIISVADVVEAMMSHRPYRAGLGLDAALDEIVQKRGILYHPDAVDCCVTLFRDKGYQLVELDSLLQS
jgi:response regulator RpfG family c-di-GMP phosphodiesterase